MTDDERIVRETLANDFIFYAKKCLQIRTKAGEVRSFQLNRAQKHIHSKLEEQKRKTGKVRALVLKGRQQGCSTYVGGRFYHKTTHTKGIQCFILTHALDATNNLFKMAQRFYENTPLLVRPTVSTNNSKELIFGGLDSGYKIGTAENKSVGRSSTIQLFHGSEVAFWTNADEHAKGIMQAVPDASNTEIILESTANGIGNYFHQMWQKAEAGQSDFIPIFVPWFWQEEYQRDVPDDLEPTNHEIQLMATYCMSVKQIAWRRAKINDLSLNGQDGEKAFAQEYPCNSSEAFQLTGENSYIESSIVMRARKCIAERFGPLLIGVDPARHGDDRTAIIKRQGRQAFDIQTYTKKDLMEVVGVVHQMIESHKPFRILVDIAGLGAGVYDRLSELGHKEILVAVNAGESPLNKERYSNKRAEMWAEMASWLESDPCQIPDDDALHADLCGIRCTYNSNSQLVMEKKEDMKKRGVRSPDIADALALTFALPESAYKESLQKPKDRILSGMAHEFNQRLVAMKRANHSKRI